MKIKPVTLIYIFIFVFMHSSCHLKNDFKRFSDVTKIENDLQIITKTEKYRNYLNVETLNFVADYIYQEFSKTCDTVYFQKYLVNGTEYKNVIGSIGFNKEDRIIIGAHYDVAGDQEGADDNASGVVGLLELSRIISIDTLKHQIDLVAYSLEEPPYFKTNHMGSYIHAKSLYENNVKIKGMICLEMIGYFNESKNSQDYPIGLLRIFYGNKGDFITVVRKFGNGKFGKQVKKTMKRIGIIKTKSFKGPAIVPGVDFSDHLNYWKFGYSAVMITNTAFYRNKNYHQSTDKMETLNLNKMSLVIDEIYLTLKQLK